MLPSGEPIFRPPANALPPGAEWQETQSAARARYSPGLAGGLVFSSARAAALPANSNSSPQRTVFEIVVTSRASSAGVTPVTSLNGRRRSRRLRAVPIVECAGYVDFADP